MDEDRIEMGWRVGRIAARAVERMGTPAEALRWLSEPHPSFGGRAPVDRCGTETGDREVLEALQRLSRGEQNR